MRFLYTIVALSLLGIPACRPHAAPTGPGSEPTADTGTTQSTPTRGLRPPLREVMVGEMCPSAAGDRAAVLPLFVRRLDWVSNPDELTGLLQKNAVRQFSVYDWNGVRAGLFSVAGTARVGLDRSAAVGAYAGGSPCRAASGDGEDPICVEAQSGCGLAVAAIDRPGGFGARPFGEDPEPLALERGKACLAGDKLLVDIDGDGRPEAYPVAQFLDPIREPAEEVLAVPRGEQTCDPRAAVRHVLPPGDPKHWRGLDLIAVIDLDGDGRFELITSYHYSERRTWAVYTAIDTAARLELAGEAVPWPRP
ncbi:MAG TPA: hypothetical protein VML75_13430 [Kofleriaceae bacterium]|nr:hypothetical protein [Kofleriaceae bacterium]